MSSAGNVQLECPVCEASVSATPTATPSPRWNPGNCPRCGQNLDDVRPVAVPTPRKKPQFRASSPSSAAPSATASELKPTREPRSVPSEPAAARAKSPGAARPEPSRPTTPAPAVSDQTNSLDFGQPPAIETLSVRAKLHAERRRRRQRRWFLVLTIVIACLTGWGVYWAQTREVPRAAQSHESESDVLSDPLPRDTPVAAETNSDGALINSPADSSPSAEQTDTVRAETSTPLPPLNEPLEWGRFDYLTRPQATALWTRWAPQLYELQIQRGAERQFVVGALVDSRGWVLTCLSAVAGADRVLCRNVPSGAQRGEDVNQLQDEARGVIAAIPEWDVCLIQINRKQVTAITPLKIAERLPLAGSYTWVVNHPRNTERAWVGEAHSQWDDSSQDPTPAIQTIWTAQNLQNTGDWQRWDSPVTLTPGTLLFHNEGDLAGIAVRGTTAEILLGVGPNNLRKLVSQATSTPQPFADLKSGGPTPVVSEQADSAVPSGDLAPDPTHNNSTTNANQNTTPPLPRLLSPPTVATESPFAAGSQRLNELGIAAADIRWRPTNEAEYQTLIDFGQQLGLAVEELRQRNLRLRDQETLKRQVQFWRELPDGLITNTHPEMIAAVQSQIPWTDFGSTAPAGMAFVQIQYPASLGNNFHYAKIEGTEVYLRIPVDAERFVMQRGTRWLVVFANLEPDGVEVTLDRFGNEKIRARKCQLLHAETLLTR